MARVRRWWVEKYGLPPNHELFQNQNLAELTQEMYEDLYIRQKELRDAMYSDDKNVDRDIALSKLNELNKILGEPAEYYDPLVAQWEKDLEEGRIPDLDAKPS